MICSICGREVDEYQWCEYCEEYSGEQSREEINNQMKGGSKI